MSSRVVLVCTGVAAVTFGLGVLLGTRIGPRSAGGAVSAVSDGKAPTVTPIAAPAPGTPHEGFTGVVFARKQVNLESTVEARVATIPVELGDRLHQGDTVATLDAESIRRELQSATASVKKARAEARAAKVELSSAHSKAARLEKLGDSVSEEELETARSDENMASARFEAARARVGESVAAVEKLHTLLQDTSLTATFDGVVAERFVDPGAIVGPGRPIIRLISGDDVWVRFAVPEDQVSGVTVDSCVEASVPSLKVATTGVIKTIAPQIDSASRMLFVEARLTVPAVWQGHLPVGLEARVRARPCTPDPG